MGLDRYPQYLSRFRSEDDMEALENALSTRLSDVRRQRTNIVERRKGIQQLVRRYRSSGTGGDENGDVPGRVTADLWHGHPALSPPKTWSELRNRNMLDERAFQVVHQSISRASRNKKRRAKHHKHQPENVEGTAGVGTIPTVEEIIERRVRVDLHPSLLEDWMSQEMLDVYSFPLLDPEVSALRRHGTLSPTHSFMVTSARVVL